MREEKRDDKAKLDIDGGGDIEFELEVGNFNCGNSRL